MDISISHVLENFCTIKQPPSAFQQLMSWRVQKLTNHQADMRRMTALFVYPVTTMHWAIDAPMALLPSMTPLFCRFGSVETSAKCVVMRSWCIQPNHWSALYDICHLRGDDFEAGNDFPFGEESNRESISSSKRVQLSHPTLSGAINRLGSASTLGNVLTELHSSEDTDTQAYHGADSRESRDLKDI